MWTKDKGGETLIISRSTVDVSGGQRDDGRVGILVCGPEKKPGKGADDVFTG